MTMLSQANSLLRVKKYSDAIDIYEHALQEYPHLSSSIRFNIQLAEKRMKTVWLPVVEKWSENEIEKGDESVNDSHSLRRLISPYFDREYYLKEYPDIPSCGIDPFDHFCLYGVTEGRSPCEYYSYKFYTNQNKDIPHDPLSALVHFVSHGDSEMRDSSVIFSSTWYYSYYPDVKLSQLPPLKHFLLKGKAEGNECCRRLSIEDYLPLKTSLKKPTVIIPIYRGLEETIDCIKSVKESRNATAHRILIINDCSPDKELLKYLNSLQETADFEILHNKRNLGFVATVNRGMSQYKESDVVLLNSDTEVADGWLDRLYAQAYSKDKTGSVTPLSNNATICSYPQLNGDPNLPAGQSLDFLNKACWEANAGRNVTIPTAVGFCMYIRRDCLDQVGLFDEEAFGKGYGEENDFCMRAINAGWHHLLALDTYVFHKGAVSFADESLTRCEAAMERLLERHPNYTREVALYRRVNEILPFHFALTAQRLSQSKIPTVLLISHGWGGGTQKHVENLAEYQKHNSNFLTLDTTPDLHGKLRLVNMESGEYLVLPDSDAIDFLVSYLKECSISKVHIHHFINLKIDIKKLCAKLDVPFDFTVHDYYTICPKINLLTTDSKYCHEPEIEGCNRCLLDKPHHEGSGDIIYWRAHYAWLFSDANNVYCPSMDVLKRIKKYHPLANVVFAPHSSLKPEIINPVKVLPLRPNEALRVVVLGHIHENKGALVLEDCIKFVENSKDLIEFYIVGDCVIDFTMKQQSLIKVLGEYDTEDIQNIIAGIDPHIIWFPAQWPETYSYTLSEALTYGAAIVAPNLGAFSERIENRPYSWIIDWDLPPADIISFFMKLKDDFFSKNSTEKIVKYNAPDLQQEVEEPYLAYGSSASLKKRTHETAKKIMVMTETLESRQDQLTPCCYIRSFLPLTHYASESKHEIIPVDYEGIFLATADVLLLQRTVVETTQQAEEIIQYCRKHNMKIYYDIDDNLLDISPKHPDYSYYSPRIEAAILIINQAEMVTVSTCKLFERLSKITPDVKIVPNALDDRLLLKNNGSFVPSTQEDTINILYMGTMTHEEDLMLLEESIKKIQDEFGRSISFDVLGVCPNSEGLSWCNFIPIPPRASCSYPAFMAWLQTKNCWHIGVAPLVDDKFNQYKSGIKYLDYSALGLASVCSNVESYNSIINDGVDGLLVDNTASAWHNALRMLIQDSELRSRMGETAQEKLYECHTLSVPAIKETYSHLRLEYN